jgi:uncharacterized protein (DUF1778 family)
MKKPVKKAPKKHIKMYAEDKFIEKVEDAAAEEGLSLSGFLFSAAKDKIKKVNK